MTILQCRQRNGGTSHRPDMGGTGRAVLDAAPGLSAHSVHKLAALPRARVWGGAALLVLVWASTALLSVPAHEALLRLRGADKDGDHDGDKRTVVVVKPSGNT